MATSSFIENIRVNNPIVMEKYAEVLEAAEKVPVTPLPEPTARRITDSEEIKGVMLKGIEKWGSRL